MSNIDIEIIWKEIDQLINKGETILFEVFASYAKLHDKLEKENFKINKILFDNLINNFYLNVFEALKQINNIFQNKLYYYFFFDALNEVTFILRYSYEWLEKNHFPNKYKSIEINYSYWEKVSFFKLVSSCIDKSSFLIYIVENNHIFKNIIYAEKNNSLSKEEKKEKTLKYSKNIDFIKLVELLKKSKESIIFFDKLSNFSEEIQNSFFWKCFKYSRNKLEHQVLCMGNEVQDFSHFTVVSIFISLRLLWFINLKSNEFTLNHVKKMLSEHDYKIMLSIINYIKDVRNNINLESNASEETKLISNMWLQSLAQGKKFDWDKYNFLNPELIAILFEDIWF